MHWYQFPPLDIIAKFHFRTGMTGNVHTLFSSSTPFTPLLSFCCRCRCFWQFSCFNISLYAASESFVAFPYVVVVVVVGAATKLFMHYAGKVGVCGHGNSCYCFNALISAMRCEQKGIPFTSMVYSLWLGNVIYNCQLLTFDRLCWGVGSKEVSQSCKIENCFQCQHVRGQMMGENYSGRPHHY